MNKKLTTEEVKDIIQNIFQQNVKLVSEYINNKSLITLHCYDCGYEWSTKACNVMYHRNTVKLHQCPNCGVCSKNGKVYKCAYCGKEVYRRQSDKDKNISGYFYCSMECGNKHKNQLRKESGEWNDSVFTYRDRAMDTYEHKCIVCGWNEDERILEVHHIDSDRDNNNIENLCILCPNCHRKITLGYYKFVDNNLIPLDSNIQTINGCQITKQVLKEMLMNNISFVEIGKKFDVSDNTVRKWCQKFGLPYKTSVVKSLTVEKWELL